MALRQLCCNLLHNPLVRLGIGKCPQPFQVSCR